MTAFVLDTKVIGCALSPESDSVPLSVVLVAFVNDTVPKLSSGISPPDMLLGSSSIHSAEECNELYDSVLVYDVPLVVSAILIVHLSLDTSASVAVMASPCVMRNDVIVLEALGNSS